MQADAGCSNSSYIIHIDSISGRGDSYLDDTNCNGLSFAAFLSESFSVSVFPLISSSSSSSSYRRRSFEASPPPTHTHNGTAYFVSGSENAHLFRPRGKGTHRRAMYTVLFNARMILLHTRTLHYFLLGFLFGKVFYTAFVNGSAFVSNSWTAAAGCLSFFFGSFFEVCCLLYDTYIFVLNRGE